MCLTWASHFGSLFKISFSPEENLFGFRSGVGLAWGGGVRQNPHPPTLPPPLWISTSLDPPQQPPPCPPPPPRPDRQPHRSLMPTGPHPLSPGSWVTGRRAWTRPPASPLVTPRAEVRRPQAPKTEGRAAAPRAGHIVVRCIASAPPVRFVCVCVCVCADRGQSRGRDPQCPPGCPTRSEAVLAARRATSVRQSSHTTGRAWAPLSHAPDAAGSY